MRASRNQMTKKLMREHNQGHSNIYRSFYLWQWYKRSYYLKTSLSSIKLNYTCNHYRHHITQQQEDQMRPTTHSPERQSKSFLIREEPGKWLISLRWVRGKRWGINNWPSLPVVKRPDGTAYYSSQEITWASSGQQLPSDRWERQSSSKVKHPGKSKLPQVWIMK